MGEKGSTEVPVDDVFMNFLTSWEKRGVREVFLHLSHFLPGVKELNGLLGGCTARNDVHFYTDEIADRVLLCICDADVGHSALCTVLLTHELTGEWTLCHVLVEVDLGDTHGQGLSLADAKAPEQCDLQTELKQIGTN